MPDKVLLIPTAMSGHSLTKRNLDAGNVLESLFIYFSFLVKRML